MSRKKKEPNELKKSIDMSHLLIDEIPNMHPKYLDMAKNCDMNYTDIGRVGASSMTGEEFRSMHFFSTLREATVEKHNIFIRIIFDRKNNIFLVGRYGHRLMKEIESFADLKSINYLSERKNEVKEALGYCIPKGYSIAYREKAIDSQEAPKICCDPLETPIPLGGEAPNQKQDEKTIIDNSISVGENGRIHISNEKSEDGEISYSYFHKDKLVYEYAGELEDYLKNGNLVFSGLEKTISHIEDAIQKSDNDLIELGVLTVNNSLIDSSIAVYTHSGYIIPDKHFIHYYKDLEADYLDSMMIYGEYKTSDVGDGNPFCVTETLGENCSLSIDRADLDVFKVCFCVGSEKISFQVKRGEYYYVNRISAFRNLIRGVALILDNASESNIKNLVSSLLGDVEWGS